MARPESSRSVGTEKGATEGSTDDKLLSNLLIEIALVVFGSAAVIVAFYIAKFRGNLPTKHEEWGQLGDYFGGLLNPIVGMATVMLVIISITIQRKELKASLRELKSANQATARMSFEQSLFAWLSNYRELVQSVHTHDATGRTALTAMYNANLTFNAIFARSHSGLATNSYPHSIVNAAFMYTQSIEWDKEECLIDLDGKVQIARQQYQYIYDAFQAELDSLPRTMYRLLLWIDSSPLSPSEKWHYAALVRAQLSWTELVLFFYNCYSNDGKAFASVANRFALFDNLNPGKDVLIEHIRRQPTREIAAPLEPRAFNSQLAKVAMGISQ